MRRLLWCMPGQWMSCLLLLGVIVLVACQAKPSPSLTSQCLGATPALTNAPRPIRTKATVVAPQLATPTENQIQPDQQNAPEDCEDGLKVLLRLSPLQLSSDAPLVMPIESGITIGWRVQNTGDCIWDNSYTVALSSTASPEWPKDDPPLMLQGLVKPGDYYDLWVETHLPTIPGEHRAVWELRNGRGEPIGERLEFAVFATGLPTNTALPGVVLRASPEVVHPGGQTAISWNASYAKAAYFYALGQAWQEHPVNTRGERYEYPQRTTTYELRIVNGDDSVEIHRVTVVVEPFEPPRIILFKIRPRGPLPNGQCVEIQWETRNRVNRVEIYLNGALIWMGKLSSGVLRHCPPSGDNLYLISVSGPGGTVTAEQPLEVR